MYEINKESPYRLIFRCFISQINKKFTLKGKKLKNSKIFKKINFDSYYLSERVKQTLIKDLFDKG